VIAEIIGDVLTWDKWDIEKLDHLFDAVSANMSSHAPHMLEEMEGIAEGSGLPYRDVLALNALADIWKVHEFCTATAWSDTPDGAVIGKTNDIGQNKEKYHQPFARRSGDGIAAIWATWPGTVWANCFVNDAGLAFGGASLGMEARNLDGVPSNCMLRLIMDECANGAEVLELYQRVPAMHHPAHIVLAEASGDVTALELTPEGVFVCQPPGSSVVRGTNHFCPGPYEGRDTNTPELLENSRRRFDNLGRLAQSLPHTVDGMLELVQDHDASGQICQHDNTGMWSSTGYVAIPGDRCMLIGHGQPCEATYKEHVL
jgi:isopenicillin-N N-acyltransferase-like protein